MRTDGSVECWGNNSAGQATPSDGSFISVSAGLSHTCGVKADGFVECWGSNDLGRVSPPDDTFISVSAGGGHTCGVKMDGSIDCWGGIRLCESVFQKDCPEAPFGQATPPGGTFVSVSAGGLHTCGVKSDGSILCWGDSKSGQLRKQ